MIIFLKQINECYLSQDYQCCLRKPSDVIKCDLTTLSSEKVPSLVRRRLRESQAGGRCVPSQSLYVRSQANTCLSGRVARGWAPRAITGMFGTKDTVKSFQFRDDQEITCSWKKKAQCLPHFQLGSFLLSVLEYCQLYVLRSVLQPSAESWKLT